MDFLIFSYPWVKALHIVSVMSWMAGLFYLPRLLVYHVERVGTLGGQTDDLFKVMEYRLFAYIMRPAMIATWIFGLILVALPQAGVFWDEIWVWAKAVSVIAMTVFHVWLKRRVADFERGTNTLSGRSYRIMNEVPTLLMLVIVFAVVVKF